MKTLEIRFDHELEDDGTLKVTKGLKHRYKERVDPKVGQVIGTLYISEAAVERMGTPHELLVTVAVA